MTQAIMKSSYVSNDGRVKINLDTSTDAGFGNNCEQYNPWGILSIPQNNCMVNIDNQCSTNQIVTGYDNFILDNNYTDKNPQTVTIYNDNWYNINTLNGISIQQANTSNKENIMMGQSTNKVLLDIMNFLQELLTLNPTLIPPTNLSSIITDITYITNNNNLAITNIYKPL